MFWVPWKTLESDKEKMAFLKLGPCSSTSLKFPRCEKELFVKEQMKAALFGMHSHVRVLMGGYGCADHRRLAHTCIAAQAGKGLQIYEAVDSALGPQEQQVAMTAGH